jgi:hypothetical protein
MLQQGRGIMAALEKNKLYEYMSPDRSHITVLEEGVGDNKSLYLEGIFIQGDVRNQNQRVYPTDEISRAVETMAKRIKENNGIPGELDHPEELSINSDRISHVITDMWMKGSDGYGKLKLLPTPTGNIAKILLQSGLRMGVSSRGSGNVSDNGMVSGFDIVTVDIVVQPSAPNAYPKVIYESLYNMKGGSRILDIAASAHEDKSAYKATQKELVKFIKELKLK